MNHTKENLNKSILNLAELFGSKDGYEFLIKSYAGTLRIVGMIVYDMFINKFDYRSCSEEQYESYQIILEFSLELREKGFVDFKK